MSNGKCLSRILFEMYRNFPTSLPAVVSTENFDLFSYDAPTLHLQKISGFITRRYAPLQKTLIFVQMSCFRVSCFFKTKNTRSSYMRILIKYPTKYRTEKALSVLSKYISFANRPEQIHIVVSIDTDDEETISNIYRFETIHSSVSVCIGEPAGKIAAINRDIPDPSTFDILLLASDDMIPEVQGYDEIIRTQMARFFPDTDGVLFFNDGFKQNRLNTLVICGSAYYRRFGYIYYPGYKSLFCDNEFMTVANRLRRQIYFPDVIIRHQHPDTNRGIPSDPLYVQNQTYWNTDQALFYARNAPSRRLARRAITRMMYS